ncbi:hypothetical protein SERLA73DRAFT_148884 [Serpula lacrymans var. lacrymans S7.3]|uniref:Uncharacterized protein n=2 Tax=Serpula lacrymans var. lacrymans TaxID=341189 RepID=F8PG69_SERL3|nr:uncharacterized protein SERLADRAFT_404505 [Serpula lacrymans var. lacrymans S7.9]EGO04316.1 hypothetical protein SERLA73DRAFT_148884 [Serpula lacrymans var. lacrymans S7.3]EGO30237.1 hypothetical protein SERLADRAFT_404505 [Serpula lacrymans var. lacrymans S7.9]
MLGRLRELRPAIECLVAELSVTDSDSEFTRYRLMAKEWEVLKDLESILSVAHLAQQTLSFEKVPVLAAAIPVYKLVMSRWELLQDKHLRLKPYIQAGLDKAIGYYCQTDENLAYVILMFLNPAIKYSWICEKWGIEYMKPAQAHTLNYPGQPQTQQFQPPQLYGTTNHQAVDIICPLTEEYRLLDMGLALD